MSIVNNLTTNKIIILILSFMLIMYAYNDYIKPMILNLINGKTIKSSGDTSKF